MSSWVPLSCSPDLWPQGTIPQPKHHPPAEERRNCVLLQGCSLQSGGNFSSSTCHQLWWHVWSFHRAHFGVSFCGTSQHPQNSCSSELSKVTHEVQVVISCLMAPGNWDFSHVKNELLTKTVVQTMAWEENFCKSYLGRMHQSFVVASFMSLLSLGFANTVSQTAASLVVQGFGGASCATKDFGVSGSGRWDTLARGGLPGFYHSFNSSEEKFSSRKCQCHKNLLLELEKVVAMKTDGLISFPVKLGAVPAMLELVAGLGRPCLRPANRVLCNLFPAVEI